MPELFALDSRSNQAEEEGLDGQEEGDGRDAFSQMLILGNPWRNKYGQSFFHSFMPCTAFARYFLTAPGTAPCSVQLTQPRQICIAGPQSNGINVQGIRLGFAGATVLDDDHTAGGALDVDERGFHRPAKGDLSQNYQDEACGPFESERRKSSVDDDPLLSASVERKSSEKNGSSDRNGSGHGRMRAAGHATTNSSWRMSKWMRDYCVLMR
jgi:hypothetical protein